MTAPNERDWNLIGWLTCLVLIGWLLTIAGAR